jgi:hypothetical protein
LLSGITNIQWRPKCFGALPYLAIISALAAFLDWRLEVTDEEYVFETRYPSLPLGAALAVCAVIVIFGAMETSAFIYFQF